MRLTPRLIVTTLGVLSLLWTTNTILLNNATHGEQAVLGARRQRISDAFQHAWNGYSKHCMGHDSIHPVSNICDDDFGGWGATAIDALSTAIMLEKQDVVEEILHFISTIDFMVVNGGTSIQMFEVVIRHLGGMISAHDLLAGPFSHIAPDETLRKALFAQMVKLGDALGCGFKTPSGVPRNWVNPTLCTSDEGTTNTVAGAGSLILEFARLSEITGNQTYVDLARAAEAYLLDPWPSDREIWPGILGSFVAVADGSLVDKQGSWGSLADSFYEYLLKAYVFDPIRNKQYLDRWLLAADSTIQYIASSAHARPQTVFLPYWQGKQLVNAMDSLSWFAGGNFILGGMITGNETLLDFGLRIANTAGAVYAGTQTGLGGEFTVWTASCDSGWGESECTAFNTVRLSTPSFKLRPEVVETWYYAYRATGDGKYREWAWNVFEAIERVCKTPTGYSAISDVDDPHGGIKLDEQESFLFAELLKYLWLFHVDDPRMPVQVEDSRAGKQNTWVFNTEAHPLLVKVPSQ